MSQQSSSHMILKQRVPMCKQSQQIELWSKGELVPLIACQVIRYIVKIFFDMMIDWTKNGNLHLPKWHCA